MKRAALLIGAWLVGFAFAGTEATACSLRTIDNEERARIESERIELHGTFFQTENGKGFIVPSQVVFGESKERFEIRWWHIDIPEPTVVRDEDGKVVSFSGPPLLPDCYIPPIVPKKGQTAYFVILPNGGEHFGIRSMLVDGKWTDRR